MIACHLVTLAEDFDPMSVNTAVVFSLATVHSRGTLTAGPPPRAREFRAHSLGRGYPQVLRGDARLSRFSTCLDFPLPVELFAASRTRAVQAQPTSATKEAMQLPRGNRFQASQMLSIHKSPSRQSFATLHRIEQKSTSHRPSSRPTIPQSSCSPVSHGRLSII